MLIVRQRLAREAARLQAEEEQRIAAEKAAQKAKRDAFLAKSSLFTQKKGPTNEEIKAEVTKSAQKRRFARSLNKALSSNPTANPLALELGMRGKTSAQEFGERDGDGEGEREGERLIVPPPPPPRPLPGLGQTLSRPPPPPLPPSVPPLLAVLNAELGGDCPTVEIVVEEEEGAAQTAETHRETERQIDVDVSREDIALDLPADFGASLKMENEEITSGEQRIEWVYVCGESEETPYYWNMCTNETSLSTPPDFDGPTYSEDVLRRFQEQYLREYGEINANEGEEQEGEEDVISSQHIIWQVCLSEENTSSENGSFYYFNSTTEESVCDRPVGTLYVTTLAEDGTEQHWQECLDAEGNIYYCTIDGEESVWERPEGTMYIVSPNTETSNTSDTSDE